MSKTSPAAYTDLRVANAMVDQLEEEVAAITRREAEVMAEALETVRALVEPPADWDDPEWIGSECRRCNSTVSCPPDYDPSPTCNSCAQEVLSEIRTLIKEQP